MLLTVDFQSSTYAVSRAIGEAYSVHEPISTTLHIVTHTKVVMQSTI